jgi:hypothetical protein
MQFVNFFQIGDRRYLQLIEMIFTGIAKVGDVAMEGGSPGIVLVDIAVLQQVVPPSEGTSAVYSLRIHGHSSQKTERD